MGPKALHVIIFGSCLAVSLAVSAVDIPGVSTTENYENGVILDKGQSYILFWKFNDSHITFEVHVKTKGWVGFGLSGNGNMFPGDVVVGWVENDGTVQFSDRHTEGHVMPAKDTSQDWHLLLGKENDFGTVLKFVRKLNTCDDKEDLVIPEGTVRLIFAYNSNDPADENSIVYHGTHRGTKSVSLLSSYRVPDNMPKSTLHFDFFNTNHMISNETTSYHCRGFYMPDIGKHHMIKYEPIITPGNELNVHHILLYRCPGVHDPASLDGAKGNCYDHRPKSLPRCRDILLAWAIGGETFYFPDNVGFPVRGPNDPSFFIMETHYDNPTQKTGFIDDSGIRITLTKDLRPMEAGLFEMGHTISRMQIIPPNIADFVSTGYCSESCVREGFKQSNLKEVKLFSAFQHSHLLGVAIKTRHFRNGTELRPIINDPDYDFDFQETRLLPQEVTVYPGDSFSVECTYDSRGRPGPTFGGLSTEDEMCLSFVYYYPAMKMVNCISEPTYDSFHVSQQQLFHALDTSDWTNQHFVAQVKANLKKSSVKHVCRGSSLVSPPHETFVETGAYTPYVPPPSGCPSN